MCEHHLWKPKEKKRSFGLAARYLARCERLYRKEELRAILAIAATTLLKDGWCSIHNLFQLSHSLARSLAFLSTQRQQRPSFSHYGLRRWPLIGCRWRHVTTGSQWLARDSAGGQGSQEDCLLMTGDEQKRARQSDKSFAFFWRDSLSRKKYILY